MRRQRGAGLLVAVILIVTVAAFAVIVAASQSTGDIRGNDLQADSVQALLLAETGVELALKRFATGTACTALGDDPGTVPVEAVHTITNLASIGIASGASITLMNGLTTDFAGAALVSSQSQCRVRVTATINVSNVSRTIHAIVDRNLLEGPDNPTFNNPLTGAAPSGWTAINPPAAIAPDGGPDGTAPNCRRSAWTAKDNPGGQDRRASGTATVQFTLTAGSVTSFWFHRRVVTRGANCVPLPPAGPAWPGACGGTGNDSQVCFQLVGAGGPGLWTTNPSANANTAGAGIAACPSTFNPCQTSYPGYPAKVGPLNVTMTGATSVNQIIYWLRIQNGGRKEMFVDNIEAVNPTAIGAAHVRVWRDCSTAADPVNCV